MLTTIGANYQRLALDEPAQRLLERAVAIRESHAPGDSSGVALSLFELGVVLAEAADFQRRATSSGRWPCGKPSMAADTKRWPRSSTSSAMSESAWDG